MESTAGMKPTGRRVSGPAFDLVELESEKGLKFTAIGYHDEFVEHPALLADLKEFGKFMERPGVNGLVELLRRDDKAGHYAYPTGTSWSVAEIVKSCSDTGETAGIRAGLELAYLAAQILQEAEEAGGRVNLFNHGSLSPWHLFVKPDGQVQIIGYGLPQVEIIDFLEDETLMPKEDSFRYAPPERLADEGEDLSSDLFVLALVALELMTGKPVYDGLINDIRQQATRGEGAYRLYKWRNIVPNHVSEALGRALKFDPDSRYGSADEFIYAMHDLLGLPDIEGPGLAEVMRRFKLGDKKGAPVMGGKTAALTREELARLAAELDDDEPITKKLAPPKRPRPGAEPEPESKDEPAARWGKSNRPQRAARGEKRDRPARSAADRGDRGAASPARGKDDLRDRLRSPRSSGGPTPAPAPAPSPAPAPAPDRRKEELRGSLRDSLGSRGGPTPAPAPARPAPPEEKTDMGGEDDKASGAAALLARLRSSSGKKPGPGEGAPRGPDPTARPPAPTPAPTPAPAPAPSVSQRAAPSPAPAARPAPSASTSRKSAKRSKRNYDNDEKAAFDVFLATGKPRKTKLRLGDTLSDAADRLAHALAATPTDLSGHLTGWYRLEQGGEWFPGDETVDVLDPSQPVTLAFVANRVVALTVEVPGIDPPGRFQAPVGTGVPSRSLVQYVVQTLGLPDGEWALFVGDTQLEPLQILEDFEPAPGSRVVVKR